MTGSLNRAQVGEADSATKVAVWQGIEAEYPPALRDEHAELLAMAEQLLASRRKRFPGMIDRRQITAEEAARQLALFEQIAADWRWIVTGEGEVAPLATLFDRAEAIDESLRTVAAIARERGGFDDARSSSASGSAKRSLAAQAHRLIAIRWHLEPGNDAALHARVALNRDLRARALMQRSDSATAEAETHRAAMKETALA